MPYEPQSIDETAINTIRTLAADVVAGANSGHPGQPYLLHESAIQVHGSLNLLQVLLWASHLQLMSSSRGEYRLRRRRYADLDGRLGPYH